MVCSRIDISFVVIIDCVSLYLIIKVTFLLLLMHQHASTVYLSRFTKSNVPGRETVVCNYYFGPGIITIPMIVVTYQHSHYLYLNDDSNE